MKKDMNTLIKELEQILTELDARENTNNCIYGKFYGISWDQLCGEGIAILEEMRK